MKIGKKATRQIGIGETCPKCKKKMLRYEHAGTWKPGDTGKAVYYLWWDRCEPCRHVQHYEEAKRFIRNKLQEEKEFLRNQIKQQLKIVK